jgi:hypothetical protein
MSLNWNISKIDNWEALRVEHEDGTTSLDPLTESFIWKSMVTGLGRNWSLDLDFAPEFYARIKLLEKLDGPLVFGGPYGDSYRVTYDDVLRRIGLSVNVSPVSRTAFLKNAVAVDLDRDARSFTAWLDKELVPNAKPSITTQA